MKKQQEQKIISLDEFDRTISLWQLLGSGTGRGLHRLKAIVNSFHHSKVEPSETPLSLLIVGAQGRRTHARCFLRALGLEYIHESPAPLVQATATEIYTFFAPSHFSDAYLISSVSLLYPSVLKTPYEILTTGEFSIYDQFKKTIAVVPVFRPIVMTTKTKSKVPGYFREKIDHIIELEEYTDQQIELIVLQRLKYANLDYKEERVLQLVVEWGQGQLDKTIRLLKDAVTFMLADSRKTLTVEDVKNVMTYS